MRKRIIEFSPAQKKYNSEKRGCTCYDSINMAQHRDRVPQYELDMKNHMVFCKICHKEVDPWEALVTFSNFWDRLEEWEEKAYGWILEAEKYKPWKRAMKEIEREVGRKGENVPVCPHCGKPFLLEEIRDYVWRALYEKERGTK